LLVAALVVALLLVAGPFLAFGPIALAPAALLALFVATRLAVSSRRLAIAAAIASTVPALGCLVAPGTVVTAALGTTTAAVAALAIAVCFLAHGLLALRAGGGRGAAEEAHYPLHHADGVGWRDHHGCRCGCRRGRGRRFTRFADGGGALVLDVGDGRLGNVEVGLGQGMVGQLARRTPLVAGAAAFLAQLVLAQAGDLVVGGVQLLVGHDHHRGAVALLDLAQCPTLFIEQEVGDFHRGLHQYLAGVVLHRMLFGDAEDRQRKRLHRTHPALAFAARADDLARLA